MRELRKQRGRPRKGGEDYDVVRERLVRAGVAALTEYGFVSTGLDQVVRAAGVPKGSFYTFFSSKEEFGLELIERYGVYFARRLDRFLLDETLSPLGRLRAFMQDSFANVTRFDYQRGCLVGNLGQEMSALPESFRQRLIDVFTDWQGRVEACLLSAQEAGEIASEIDCARKAELFWIGWEGAILRAKLERRVHPLEAYSEDFFKSLKLRHG